MRRCAQLAGPAIGVAAVDLGSNRSVSSQRPPLDRVDGTLPVAWLHPLAPPGSPCLGNGADVFPLAIPVIGPLAPAEGYVVSRLVTDGGADIEHVRGRYVLPLRVGRSLVDAAAVPARGSGLDPAALPVAADPDRDPRLLDGGRRQRQFVDPEMPAVRGDRLPGPQPGHDV